MTYNTNQFIHVNYAVGSGGNFLITCLFLFDNIAHWDSNVQQKKLNHEQWLDSVWSTDYQQWVYKEPWMPWNISCYSRRLDRGSKLTQYEYDSFVESHASEYFHQCWNKKLGIVDRFNKGKSLNFIDQGIWIDIIINQQDIDIYKSLIKKKLWLWDESNKTITSQLDSPEWIKSKYVNHEDELKNRMSYNNQYQITGYTSFDDFFENYLRPQPYLEPYITSSNINNNSLVMPLGSLVKFDKFVDRFSVIEDRFNQTVNHDLLKKYHSLWTTRSEL